MGAITTSAEPGLKGKAKKAKRDEERRKAGKKRKRHQETQALPEVDDDPEGDDAPLAASTAEAAPVESKKRKPDDAPIATSTAKAAPAESKKRKHDDETQSAPEPADGAVTSAGPSKKRRKTKTEKSDDGPKKQRFIVFVGNLPYTITNAGIQEHFAKVKPESIRHMTEPGTTKSKGYAFLEFADFDRMKTCLSLYHHTTIDSRVGGAKGIKKINVELTAGGGGNSTNRKDKLKTRNTRLQEQRQRKAEAVAKAEKRKVVKEARHGNDSRYGDGVDKVEKPLRPTKTSKPEKGEDEERIHPARLARINAG